MRVLLALLFLLVSGASALAQDKRPDEDELFGKDSGVEDLTKKKASDDNKVSTPDTKERTFTIGGMAYLRLQSFVLSEGAFEKQRFMMPNLLDVYLDARPDARVRAFVSGRMLFDPTVEE